MGGTHSIGHAHGAENARMKSRAAAISIAVNVVLLTLKSIVAVLTGSVALGASAADSPPDLTPPLFAFFGVRIGSRPPDDTHAYGHEKFESLASLVQLGMLFITVAFIASEAFQRLRDPVSVTTTSSSMRAAE